MKKSSVNFSMGTDSFLPSKIDKLENWDINEDEKKWKYLQVRIYKCRKNSLNMKKKLLDKEINENI